MYPGVLIPVSTPCEIPAAEDFAMTGLTRAGYADINALFTCEAARERNVRTITMTKSKSRHQLSRQEAKDVLRRSAPSATAVFEAIRHEAVEELEREQYRAVLVRADGRSAHGIFLYRRGTAAVRAAG